MNFAQVYRAYLHRLITSITKKGNCSYTKARGTRKATGMDSGKLCSRTAICTWAIIAKGWDTAQGSTSSKMVLDTTVNGGAASNTAKELFGTPMERDTRVRRTKIGTDSEKRERHEERGPIVHMYICTIIFVSYVTSVFEISNSWKKCREKFLHNNLSQERIVRLPRSITHLGNRRF